MAAFDPTANHRNHDGASAVLSRPGNLIDRMPPSNLQAEMGVLASVLLDNAAMHDVAAVLTPGDFFRSEHEELYRAILGHYDAGRAFDLVILAETLGPRLAAVGGHEALARIMESVPHAANAGYYARIVREKAVARSLIEAATEILRDGYANESTAEQLVEAAERRIFAVAEAESTGETLPAPEVISLVFDRLATREEGEVPGLGTGFPDLDDRIDGLQPGSLVILAARPAVGKSAIAMSIADHVAVEGGSGVLFVSLEMNRIELGARLITARAGVDSYRLKNPAALSIGDRRALGEARQRVARSRLMIDDTPIRTVTQIAANARRIKARSGLGLVVIDYIQLIDGQRSKGESRQEEVARVSKRLKGLARELEVPVIALAQLNRQSETRDDRRPRLADLRESGQLEADADIVLLLHRPEMYDVNDRPGEADLIIAKNRMGGTGVVRLAFRKECTRFASLSNLSVHEPIPDDPGF